MTGPIPSNASSAVALGGDGADAISGHFLRVDAGKGNDWVYAFSPLIDLGDGDDVFLPSFVGSPGVPSVTLGAGRDTIVLPNSTYGYSGPRIVDFAPGNGGDRLDVTSAVPIDLPGDARPNPFGTGGTLRLLADGADTLVQIGFRPPSGAVTWNTALRLVNVAPGALTAENLGGFAPDGSNPPGLVVGTPGDDTLTGGPGDDRIFGRDGADRLDGAGGRDSLDGAEGDDVLLGGAGDDTLSGGAGYDALRGGAGADVLDGGAGIDVLDLSGATGRVRVDLGLTGIQAISREEGRDLLRFIEDARSGSGDDILIGSAEANRLSGNDGADRLLAGAGKDFLEGGAGNDLLDGGTGGDTMRGGAGNDIYVVDDAADVVIEENSIGGDPGGLDRVVASISYTLPRFVEDLRLDGTAGWGTGNGLANRIGQRGDELPLWRRRRRRPGRRRR
ncbi:hypothetical protein ACE7GA_16900 [Roseomonas sp. CCTCC AB2023176]|uniref:calcium-binding protein n=1 Tax=Roseomonas sp. CCTCC AB2023176 TaxID=3342640 RepID=UPI0035DDDAB1